MQPVTFYDVEVFKHGWSVIFKQGEKTKTFVSKKDEDAIGLQLKRWLEKEDPLLGGFNSKHYDDHILMAMTLGYTHAEIKELNDWIIGGQQGWTWDKFPQYMTRPYKTFDTRDDLPIDLSLKAIEANLGMNIVESSVPFDLDRPLTDEEWDEVIEYNKYDVEATEKLYHVRKSYFDSKIAVGELIDLEPHRALRYTNAKLSAVYLGAKRQEFDDERNYTIPNEVNLDRIPREVLQFFEKLKDDSIKDDDLWSQTLSLDVDGCEYVYGFGGVHGALPNYTESETSERVILNYDVASLYPNLMIHYGYVSRSVLDPLDFKAVVEKRLSAKKAGNYKVSDALKLVINTTYGAMLNKYNDLYDPRMARSVCITGQLLLTDLVMGLKEATKSLKVINFNTDGVMFSIDKDELERLQEPLSEWQERTHLTLERDDIKSIWQKDVNNYIMETKDSQLKTKGGYLATYEGSHLINGSLSVVSRAIVNYFTMGIDPRIYIQSQQNPKDYQMTAKAGRKFNRVMWESSKGEIEVQKVNRVYASKNKKDGTLYKYKLEDGSKHKIASLPTHCLIDNENQVNMSQIDKQFYIDLAYKRIHDYIGVKETKMSNVGSDLPTVANRKTYKRLLKEVRVFEKGEVIPLEWEEATTITKKQYDTHLESTEEIEKKEEPQVEEKETKMTEPKVQIQPNGLAEKIFALRESLRAMIWTKDGTNQHQEYKYISGDQYKKNLNTALVEVGLDFAFEIHSVRLYTIAEIGGKQNLTEIVGQVKLIDPTTGLERNYSVVGQGSDMGDKGIYKAQTGALKYFISTNFLVGESDDPEDETPPKVSKPKFVSPSKREEIKEQLMTEEPLASVEDKNLIKDYMSQLGDSDEHLELINKIKSYPFKTLTQNQATELIIELEEVL